MKTHNVQIPFSLRVLLAIVLVPLVELTLLVQLYQSTGFLATLLLVVLTGILGVTLARRQGLQIWREIEQQLAQGRNPSVEIMNGVMILFAGALLMTPGLLTDCVGFGLLIPWIRTGLGRRLSTWFRARTLRQFGRTWSTDPTADPMDADEHPSVRVLDPSRDQPSSAAG